MISKIAAKVHNKYVIEMKEFNPQIIFTPINDLKPYENNSKIHSQEQIEKIASQISSFGFDQPIVISTDGSVIKGHGRLLAAKKLGMEKVPCIVVDLTPEEAKAVRIADNKVAQSPWDEDRLKLELASLRDINFDLSLTGFDLTEVESFFRGLTESKKEEIKEFPEGSPEDQQRLDQSPYMVECPSCKYKFLTAINAPEA